MSEAESKIGECARRYFDQLQVEDELLNELDTAFKKEFGKSMDFFGYDPHQDPKNAEKDFSVLLETMKLRREQDVLKLKIEEIEDRIAAL